MSAQLTWLGHGTWLIETGEHRILLDPFLDESPTAPISAADVQCDVILASHGHFDHVADLVAVAQRTSATVVSNFEICGWCEGQGVENTEAMNTGGAIDLPFGTVKSTWALHSSALPDGSNGGNPGGFLLTIADGKKLYFACDTALFSDMRLIGRGGLDLAVLPIGDRFTMGPEDAVEAVKLLTPRRVVPAHYNTWPPIEQDAHAWADRIRDETDTEPVVLAPGSKIEI